MALKRTPGDYLLSFGFVEEAEDDGEKSLTGKYTTFWNQFGKLLKLGIIEDSSNRQRLAKLLRFYTSKSTEKLVSLEEYIERMKPNQKKIYFFIGEIYHAMESSR